MTNNLGATTNEINKETTPGEIEIESNKEILSVEKIKNDLRGGFRVEIRYGQHTRMIAECVTRNGNDLFFVEAEYANKEDPDIDFSFESYTCDIRRRTGTATLEKWHFRQTTQGENTTKFRAQPNKGGYLSENAFIEKYHASKVDHTATEDYRRKRMEELKKAYNGPNVLIKELESTPEDEKVLTAQLNAIN